MAEKTELRILRNGRHPSSAQRRWLPPGTAIHLGQGAGELTVLAGRAWLTRSDDVKDYILQPGEHVVLEQSHRGVVESAAKGQGVTYSWRPHCGRLEDPKPRSWAGRALHRRASSALANETADVE